MFEKVFDLSKLVEIGSLRPNMRNLDLKFRVVEISEPKEVVSRKDGSTHRVAEAVIGDGSGIVTMTLWDDNIKFEPGQAYLIRNVFTGFFKNHLRINLGRNSEIEVIEDDIGDINTDNDLSAKEYKPRFRAAKRGYRPKKRGFKIRRQPRFENVDIDI